MALKYGYKYAFVTAFIVFLMTIMSYKLLIIGAFLVLYTGYHIKINKFSMHSIYHVFKIPLFIFGLIIIFYAYLHLWTNFDPIVAFIEVRHWQSIFDRRTYSYALIMNLYDFSLGMGYIPILLFFYYLYDTIKSGDILNEPIALSWISIATIFIINISGLTNLETARIWLLLQPIVLIPAVIVIEEWVIEQSIV